jgi:hypothetical protein
VPIVLQEILEKLVEDDSDMLALNLSAKEEERMEALQRQLARASSAAGTPFDVPLGASSVGPEVRVDREIWSLSCPTDRETLF